jgi:hypothetical protein
MLSRMAALKKTSYSKPAGKPAIKKTVVAAKVPSKGKKR